MHTAMRWNDCSLKPGWIARPERPGEWQNMSAGRVHSLATIDLFRELEPAASGEVERRVRWRQFKTGQTVVGYQDDSHELCFLLSGRLLEVGDSIAGMRVTEIRESAVVLQGPGEQRTLELFPSVGKRKTDTAREPEPLHKKARDDAG